MSENHSYLNYLYLYSGDKTFWGKSSITDYAWEAPEAAMLDYSNYRVSYNSSGKRLAKLCKGYEKNLIV